MLRQRVVGQSAIYVIAHNCHSIGCRRHIGITCGECLIICLKVLLKLGILRKGRKHRHHNGCTVSVVLGADVIRDNIRSLLEDTDENISV